jgi:hypothetical protein
MIIERGYSMAEPELSCEQMEVQVGRLAMRSNTRSRAPSSARRDKSGRGRRQSERLEAPMDVMRDILSGFLKEVVGFAQRGPIHLILAGTRTR